MNTETAARPAPQTLTLYTTGWCPFCLKLKSGLRADGIEFLEVDIEQEPYAADFVAAHNDGNHTVPTVHFPGGDVMTNPSIADVHRGLAPAAR